MKVLLASKSPRRQQILKEMAIPFDLVALDTEEHFEGIPAEEVAEFLAVKKSNDYEGLKEGEVLITADTTVLLEGEIINKPADREDAIQMLRKLSGREHLVITGVCLRTFDQTLAFSDITRVTFGDMSKEEIEYYVDTYEPFDKAGAYGIQEWIGVSHIASIEGSFFNVMGLPSHLVYKELRKLGFSS